MPGTNWYADMYTLIYIYVYVFVTLFLMCIEMGKKSICIATVFIMAIFATQIKMLYFIY